MLKDLDAHYPAEAQIRLILDNHSAHISKETRAYLATRPNRFCYVHTPTHGSWLNLVERFFRDLSQDVVLPGSFASVGELTDAIWTYLAERNLKPQRYEWRAEGKAILEKIHRAREALARPSPVAKDPSETLH